ncbi:alpha/beta fold hydrolase [Tumebacillus permanentifrigoris]|uniref:Alpha/beta hydrolase family protein n=1 Tax=Tumebacillus permanentifrigoris TaxID=378543 RepID=A0A316D8J8_9BACL|nr:alpha/beta fold hydrolase [Tumebacillus permanentifrigoris]PWK13116.1 alpha/beta hydrolase family protein [Tumebacillus permanentifrigoris]
MYKKLLAKTLDQIGITFLYRERSKQSHFKPASGFPSAEFADVYPAPDVPELTMHPQEMREDGYEVGRYTYDSPMTSSHPENDGARGEYYIRRDHNPEPVNVIVVHGWRMIHLERVHKMFTSTFLAAGYDLYFPTIPYHFDRALEGSYSGEHLVTADADHSIRSMRQTIAELRALIRWVKRERGGKVIVVGVSMGGYFSNMMAVTEENTDYVISVMYGNSLTYSVWDSKIGRFIKQDLLQGGMTREELQQHWSILEPTRWSLKVRRENMLFLHGMYDEYVHPRDAEALWEAWGRPRRILYPCGHAGIVLYRRHLARDAMHWLEERFREEREGAHPSVAVTREP